MVEQSAISDKKVEIERAKLVEQSEKTSQNPSERKKLFIREFQLYNSMVLGIQGGLLSACHL